MMRIYDIKIDREKREPVYIQFRNELRKILKSGKSPSGTRLPSLRRIGKHLGISFLTVSKAVDELCGEGLLETVGGSGIYIKDKKDTLLGPVALFLGNPESYMPMKLLEGISGKLKNSGADILLKDSGIKGNIHVFAEEVQEHPFISGIIVQGDILLETPDVKKKLEKLYPLVTIDCAAPASSPGVISDDESGMLKITERILKNGHRKVVFLGSPEHSSTGQLRKRAFTRYASERGIEYSVYDNISSENDAYLNSMRAFHEEEGFTAMVCWNDTIAAGAMEFFLKNKISIPNDMALSGFGNLDFSARLSSPLTTVEQNFPEMGSRAVELLIKKIKKPGLQGELIKVETELIIRESL